MECRIELTGVGANVRIYNRVYNCWRVNILCCHLLFEINLFNKKTLNVPLNDCFIKTFKKKKFKKCFV